MCEKVGKQVRFRPAEALKFDSVELFYIPRLDELFRKTTINPSRVPQPKIRFLIRAVLIYFFLNSFAPTVGIRSYARKKEVHQILAKSFNIYPPNMGLGISHGIYIGKITRKRKICITLSICIPIILFPWTKICMICLKYLHSRKIKKWRPPNKCKK